MINRNFTLLLTGQLISQAGDKFHMIALSLWVLKTTGSTGKTGVVLAASILPSLLVGFFSGAVVDRYHRKKIMIGTDLIRGLLIGVFTLLFCLNLMTFRLVLLMQILLSVNAAFFDPAVPAVIPTIVSKRRLVRANAAHQFVSGFAMVAGAVCGGLFVSIFGFAWVFGVNAVSFLVSAFFECFIDIPDQAALNQERYRKKRFFSDLKSGYQYLFAKSSLLVLLFMVMIIHFFVGSIEILMPVIAEEMSGDSGKILGVFHGAFGSGTIMMAFLLGWINISGKETEFLFGSVSFMGLLYVAADFLSRSEQWAQPALTGVIFVFGASVICAAVSFRTLLQKQVDNRFSGRVFAVAGSLGNAAVPLAMLAYGFLLEIYMPQGLLMVSGLVLMGVSMISVMVYKEKKDGPRESRLPEGITEN